MENITTKNNTQNPGFPIVVPSGETATKEEIEAFKKAMGFISYKAERHPEREKKAWKEQEARYARAKITGECPYPPETQEVFQSWAISLGLRKKPR